MRLRSEKDLAEYLRYHQIRAITNKDYIEHAKTGLLLLSGIALTGVHNKPMFWFLTFFAAICYVIMVAFTAKNYLKPSESLRHYKMHLMHNPHIVLNDMELAIFQKKLPYGYIFAHIVLYYAWPLYMTLGYFFGHIQFF